MYCFKVVEEGSHLQLLKANGMYTKLVQRQLLLSDSTEESIQGRQIKEKTEEQQGKQFIDTNDFRSENSDIKGKQPIVKFDNESDKHKRKPHELNNRSDLLGQCKNSKIQDISNSAISQPGDSECHEKFEKDTNTVTVTKKTTPDQFTLSSRHRNKTRWHKEDGKLVHVCECGRRDYTPTVPIERPDRGEGQGLRHRLRARDHMNFLAGSV